MCSAHIKFQPTLAIPSLAIPSLAIPSLLTGCCPTILDRRELKPRSPLDMSAGMTKLEKASHLAQIISAVAVIISIVYLAQQVRENTVAVSFDINEGLLDLQFQSDFWDKDAAHVAMAIRGTEHPDSLSEVEWWQYRQRVNSVLNVWWLAFLGHEKGIMDDDVWGGWDAGYRRFLCRPGTSRVWDEVSLNWAPSFTAHVEQARSDCPVTD